MNRFVCALLQHRWEPDPNSKETYPVLRCSRCGKTNAVAERSMLPGRPVAAVIGLPGDLDAVGPLTRSKRLRR
jgi:hypothetical protein